MANADETGAEPEAGRVAPRQEAETRDSEEVKERIAALRKVSAQSGKKLEKELTEDDIRTLWVPTISARYERNISPEGEEVVVDRIGAEPQAKLDGLRSHIATQVMIDLAHVASSALLTRIIHVWRVVSFVQTGTTLYRRTLDERFSALWKARFVEMVGAKFPAGHFASVLSDAGLGTHEQKAFVEWAGRVHGIVRRRTATERWYEGISMPVLAVVDGVTQDAETSARIWAAKANAKAMTDDKGQPPSPSPVMTDDKGQRPTLSPVSPTAAEPPVTDDKGEGSESPTLTPAAPMTDDTAEQSDAHPVTPVAPESRVADDTEEASDTRAVSPAGTAEPPASVEESDAPAVAPPAPEPSATDDEGAPDSLHPVAPEPLLVSADGKITFHASGAWWRDVERRMRVPPAEFHANALLH